VSIQVEKVVEDIPGMLKPFFEGQRQRAPRRRLPVAGGSGFVISSDGYIVTNFHVVDEASKIEVVFQDGSELEARPVGMDEPTDLALIKVDSPTPLTPAPLGDSDAVRVGDWVMAIGNPLGLDHTVTVGILSAKGRRNLTPGRYDDFLQTDASINPGNSGGPLLDMKGRVIGINTMINPNGQNIGFSIPINMAKSLLPQLRESGQVTRGWLGVKIQPITPVTAKGLNFSGTKGAVVADIFDGSPAEVAKFEDGDVIVEFNGQPIDDVDDLPRRVAETKPGESVNVVVIRNGKRTTLKPTIVVRAEEEDAPTFEANREEESEGAQPQWGFEAEEITPSLAERLQLDDSARGLAISEVDPHGPAAQSGLEKGDQILSVNRKEVRTTAELEAQLQGSSALFFIRRGEGTIFVPVEKE
jgi:serine protease Do